MVGRVEAKLRAIDGPVMIESLVPGDLVTPREECSACWSTFVICSAPKEPRDRGLAMYARPPEQIVMISRHGALTEWDCWRAPCTE